METDKRKRNGEIDFWKLIFSLVVVSCHAENFISSGTGYFKGGSIAVDFFFIISGVMMARSSFYKPYQGELGKDTFNFIKKKIMGFMPHIWVAWFIAFVVKHWGRFSIVTVAKDLFNSIGELCFTINAGYYGYLSNGATWYISAMLLLMIIIWPLMRKYGDTFFYLIAPVIVIFLMGYTYQNFMNLKSPLKWLGFCMSSMLRGMMEICMGCIAFRVMSVLKKVSLTTFSKTLVTLFSWAGYLGVIVYSYNHDGSTADWTLVVIIWISIILTGSEQGISFNLFSHRFFQILGIYSFSLYLGHGFWSQEMPRLFPGLTENRMMHLYIILSVITGLMISFLSSGISKFWTSQKESIKKVFVN